MFDLHDPKFWVGVAFVLFMALLLWNRVPAMIGKMLDARAEAIKKELDEARRLREEAQALLADYQKKAREAENEAKSIIEQAQREAEAMAADTQRSLKESLERRTKMAEDKIARAEAQALSEVRATAVDTAIAAAEQLLKDRVAGAHGSSLIDQNQLTRIGESQMRESKKPGIASGFFCWSLMSDCADVSQRPA